MTQENSSAPVPAQIAEIQTLQSQIRRWRIAAVLAVLLIMGVCAKMIVEAFTDLAQEGPAQEKFMKHLVGGVKEHVMPTAQRIASQTASQIVPEVQKEIDKLNERAPEITEAALKELELLAANLPDRGEKILVKTFGEMMHKREEKLKKQFPEITDQKIATLVNNLISVAEVQAEEVSAILFADHINAVDRVANSLHAIQKAEAPTLTQQDIPSWQVGLMLFDLFREEIRPLEVPLTPSTNASPIKLKKKAIQK
jgi:ATP-dependent Zn protease